MIIYLKNKHQLACRNMVKQVLDQGGMPDYIEIDQFEAFALLKEMQKLRDDKLYKKKWEIDQQEGNDITFLVYGGNEIDEERGRTIITRWLNGDFELWYHYKERDPKESTVTNTVYIEADVEVRVKLVPPPQPAVPRPDDGKAAIQAAGKALQEQKTEE